MRIRPLGIYTILVGILVIALTLWALGKKSSETPTSTESESLSISKPQVPVIPMIPETATKNLELSPQEILLLQTLKFQRDNLVLSVTIKQQEIELALRQLKERRSLGPDYVLDENTMTFEKRE